jgi:UDP-N-acetyl-D-mannosaminuronate dehydrogenase
VVVVVPLFVDADGVPDFGWMDNATRAIAAGLKPGTLVSYETTLPVGTTRNRWAPMLEQGSGLTAGKDFTLVFSPERVLTGRVFCDLRRYPKLVGGIDEASAKHGVSSTSRCSTSTRATTCRSPTASGTSGRRRRRSSRSSRRPPTAT